MPEEQSLSIEETNKLRISLGLKPLQVDPALENSKLDGGAPEDDNGFDAQERRAVANWQKHQDELEKESFREQQREEIRKAKDAAKRFARLEGKGLADEPEGGEEDALEWVRKMKKRQKKIAKRMAVELAERDATAQKLEYSERDVRGLNVAHDQADILDGAGMEGNGVVLTLKDATIDELEAEGDELENVELGEKEKLRKRLDLKKKKKPYDAYEDDIDENGEKRILAQYDEEIEPEKNRKRFMLGTIAEERDEIVQEAGRKKLKLAPISLDIESMAAPLDSTGHDVANHYTVNIEPELGTDYFDLSEVRLKKSKKKKPRSTRRKGPEDDVLAPAPAVTTTLDDPNSMELDETPVPSAPKRTLDEFSFIDDEELQSSLALQRRMALKQRNMVSRPEGIARQVRQETANENGPSPGMEGYSEATGMVFEGRKGSASDDEEEPGLVIDETTEFVSNLRAPVLTERKRRRSTIPSVETAMVDEDEEGDIDMDHASHMVEEEEDDAEVRVNRESTALEDITSTGLDSEQTLTRGIGATLVMLNQRGLLQRNPGSAQLLELTRAREKFQAEKRLKQLEAERRARSQREADRKSGIFDKMSAKEREEYARWENKQRDVQEAKEMTARFKDYKPNVKLEYKDEFGREMTQKEAFKYLSHQFHGKGSGKLKTEKRLKRIEDERKRMAASSLQGTGEEGMVGGLKDKAKMKGQAGVRLM